MDRRESLKLLAFTTFSGGLLLKSCNPANEKLVDAGEVDELELTIDRTPEELAYEKSLLAAGRFFTDHEMATIAVLSDIIIPADEISGSATDAKVPDFIEFMAKDRPEYQVPLRGGLRWLDMQMASRHGTSFIDSSREQQIALIDEIAYPERAKPEMKPGVSFFNRMRSLTAAGFYTSPIGIKDLEYEGNTPNLWNGVPEEVLNEHGLAYTEKEIKECVQYP